MPAPGARPSAPRRGLRGRCAIVYDLEGPKVRLGVGWAVLVAASLAYRPIRPYGTAVLFGIVAGFAALQIVDRWDARHPGADRWVAALGASAMPVLASASTQALGAAVLVFVLLSVLAALFQPKRLEAPLAAAGQTVYAGLFVGLAAASVVITLRYQIGAVITLLVLIGVYEASDYLVGSGASNAFEGPLAGIIAMAPAAFIIVILAVPPFGGVDAWQFAALAAFCCPVGQLLASAMLPSPQERAPALRRLDSLLVLGPAWAWLIGLYLMR